MFSGRRLAVALTIALTATAVTPGIASATPSTTSRTSTTRPPSTTAPAPTTTTPSLPALAPPPPPFSLPLDLGLQLLQQRAGALQDLRSYGSALPQDQRNEVSAQRTWNALQRKLRALDAKIRLTQHQLDVARTDLQDAAVQAYMSSDNGQLEAAISAIASASDALEVNRKMQLIGSYGDEQHRAELEYVALTKQLAVEQARLTAERRQADSDLASAKAKLADDQTQIAHAHVRLVSTVTGILQFEKAATSASSPILGPSALTARQLADFVRASGHRPRITVSIDELAQDYVVEGELAGVRGDVAFAQSILETDWFTFPGGGQVLVNDNNFAGIGACDTCAHGFSFPTADIGVRAQMQALRIYVDPNLTDKTLTVPLVMPKMLGLGFRGKVQTWWDLWGTWATGAFYGQRLYDIYERMVAFAATDVPPRPPHG